MNQQYTFKILISAFNRWQKLKTISNEDILYSKIILSKDYPYHHKWLEDMVQRYIQLKDITKHPNALMRLSGVEYVPLLLG